MKLSIVIPIFNSEKYLNKCIDSIFKYHKANIEVILINDGSTDKSLEICKQYESKYSNIVLINKKNEGQGIARNYGIKVATGDYITFVDSDDFFEDDVLDYINDYIEKQKLDFYIFNWNYVFNDKKIKNVRNDKVQLFYKEDMKFKLFLDNMVWPNKENSYGSAVWAKFYNLKIIKENNIKFHSEREMFSEDLIFNLEYIEHINNVVVLDKTIYCYYQNSTSYKNKYHGDYIDKLNNIYFYFKEKGYLSNEYKSRIYIRLFSYIKSCFINEIMHFKYKVAYKNVKEICEKENIYNIICNCDKVDNKSDKLVLFLIRNKLYFFIVILYKILRIIREL